MVKNTAFICGPVIISFNYVRKRSILQFAVSKVVFYKNTIFEANFCGQAIFFNQQYPYVEVMEHANITFTRNKIGNKLVEGDNRDINFRYYYCFFQYVTSGNELRVTPKSYTVYIINTTTVNVQQQDCSFIYYYLNPHCHWLPTAAFQNNDSETINHQIIKLDEQHVNYHKICLCFGNESFDCSSDVLGSVYPGQRLQVGVCTPCSNKIFTLYAESYNSLLENVSCRITNQAEIVNTINNYTKSINYTIASEDLNTCKLFLTISSDTEQYAHEVFYVKLLPYPVGFTARWNM